MSPPALGGRPARYPKSSANREIERMRRDGRFPDPRPIWRHRETSRHIHPRPLRGRGIARSAAPAVQAITTTDKTISAFAAAGVVVERFTAKFRPSITGNFLWSIFDGPSTSGVHLRNVSLGTVWGNSIAATFNDVDLPNCLLCGIDHRAGADAA